MAVLRHETITPCRHSPQTGCAHHAGDHAMKGVALKTHELGKRLVAAKKIAVRDEIDLRTGLFGGEPQPTQI